MTTALFWFTAVFAGIWLSGGIVAIILMVIRTINHPEWDRYTLREFLIGFVGSWYTVAILIELFEEDL